MVTSSNVMQTYSLKKDDMFYTQSEKHGSCNPLHTTILVVRLGSHSPRARHKETEDGVEQTLVPHSHKLERKIAWSRDGQPGQGLYKFKVTSC